MVHKIMEKQIKFIDVNVFKKNLKTNLKILKSLSLEFNENDISAIVSESALEFKTIVELIQKKNHNYYGKIEFNGEYFKAEGKFTRNRTTYIQNNNIENLLSSKMTMENFLLEGIKDRKLQKKFYEDVISETKNEISKLISELKYFKSNNKYKKWWIGHQISIEKNNVSKNIKELKIYTKNQNQINKFNSIIKESKNEIKIIKREIADSKELFFIETLSKDHLIKKQIKSKLFLIEKLKMEEEQILSVPSDLFSKNEEIHKSSLKTILKEAFAFLRFINLNEEHFLNLSKNNLTKLNRLKDKLNLEKTNLDKFIFILKNIIRIFDNVDLDQNSPKEVKLNLNIWIKYLNDLIDPYSLINNPKFKEVEFFIKDDLNEKIKYFKIFIEDLEKKAQEIVSMDKLEKDNNMRKLWEFETISLRFQKQIYREKLEITEQYKNKFILATRTHNYENISEYFDIYKEYEDKFLEIDLSLNKWRLNRKNMSLKLEKKTRILAMKKKIEVAKQEIKRINQNQLSFKEYNDILDINVDKIISKKIKEINFRNLTPLQIEEKINAKNEILKKLKEQKSKLKQIKNKLNFVVGFNLKKLLEDLKIDSNLKNDFEKTTLNSLSYSQIHILLIMKGIIENDKIIITSNPNPNDPESEIVKKFIRKMSKKYKIMFIILTTDIRSVVNFAKNVNIISKGTNIESGNLKKILCNPLHPFTKEAIKKPLNLIEETENNLVNNYLYKNLYYNQYTDLKLREAEKHHLVYSSSRDFEKWITK
ncbi:MAG: hypothetical protein TYPL_4800 [Candidatus Tyloplasma litorale]|nr:MAG: hypothetical protein TYPL_4800 [Mycoplasmatales bacterium]